jgi:hypothetical protein
VAEFVVWAGDDRKMMRAETGRDLSACGDGREWIGGGEFVGWNVGRSEGLKVGEIEEG